MPRISDAELARLKRDVSLELLVTSSGVKLERRGAQLMGLCPFHDDNDPSLVVSPRKNLWNCLGACGTGGSVIDWVMKREGLSFVRAVEALRERAGTLAAPKRNPKERPTEAQELAVAPYAETDTQVKQALAHYHATLTQSPDALGYLERRGLRHSELVEYFQLGYCDRTLGLRLPDQKHAAGRDIRGKLKASALLRESGAEHFAGCITVPLFDAQGRVAQVYGRRISQQGTKRAKHLYLPGPLRGIFNLPAVQTCSELILCESVLDAMTFWAAGYRNVTTSYGVNGFTDELWDAMRAHQVQRVLIAYDRDDAGDKAATVLSERIVAAGMTCFRVAFPRGMDANTYALKVAPAERSLGLAIRKAQWLGGKQREVSTAATEPVAIEMSRELAAEGQSVEGASSSAPTTASTSSFTEPSEVTPPALLSTTATGSPPAPAPLAASPLPEPPQAPRDDAAAEVKPEEVVMAFGTGKQRRRWRVRGLARNTTLDALKVNLLCSVGDAFHVDALDLYSARHRGAFLREATVELGVEERVLKQDLGRVLLELERLQHEQLEAKSKAGADEVMTEHEREQALELLRAPDLLDRILADFDRCGVVGERTNKLVGYLAAVSRKLQRPLAVILQSSSAAGKSSLMNAVLELMPPEQRVQYSAMTGQSLFYMGESDLAHKILAVVEEQGAERAAYALKLLQSEGELTIASTGKDPVSGRHVTHEYRVKGPVMIFLTTTAMEVDEELLNRCLVLTVDESAAQTAAIQAQQRRSRTMEGLWTHQERLQVQRLHQNAQRLLEPVQVLNPYAEALTFRRDRMRTRRDHEKYLTLIDAVALLHQHQRPRQTREHEGRGLTYIEVALEDIAVANRLAREVLGRSLDELPPQTRRLLGLLDAMVSAGCGAQGVDRDDYRFTRRQVCEHAGWSLTQVRLHLGRLVEHEYVLAHRGANGSRFVYELLVGGGSEEPGLSGLVDVEALGPVAVPPTWRGQGPTWRGGGVGVAGRGETRKRNGSAVLGERWRPEQEHVSGADEPLSLSAVAVGGK